MFDRVGLAGMGDEALISALTAATQDEAKVAARRLALIGEVIARQCDGEDDDHAHQVVDGWAWAQAAVAAACNLNPHAASKQMRIAQALRDRLPRTAALFASGVVSATVIDAITWRTHLVEDPDALALIDAAIAGEAGEYGAHSEKQLIGAVDVWVEKFDPDAVVRSKRNARDLYVEFGDKDDPNGVASFWGGCGSPTQRSSNNGSTTSPTPSARTIRAAAGNCGRPRWPRWGRSARHWSG